MRKSSVVGLLVGFVLIIGSILVGTGWSKFLDPASLLVVLGGTGAAVTVTRTFDELKIILSDLQDLFTFTQPDLQRYADQIANFGRIARREGMLALDRRLDEVDDDLLRFGLELMIDGSDEDEIRSLLNQRIAERRERRDLLPESLTLAGTYAPAFGMVGTLIGLIQMLQNLNDPTQIGSGMATALVTTFYGAVLANLMFLPLSNRADAQNQAQEKVEYLVREGVLAITRGEGPRMVKQRLEHLTREEESSEEEEEDVEEEVGEATPETEAQGDPQPAAAAA